MKAYLGLGSNMGDRKQNLDEAIKKLDDNGLKIVKKSSVYETQPIGYKDQADFYNQVIEIETEKSPEELLKLAKGIEAKMGRKQTFTYGPRVIDIDILIYDSVKTDNEDLTLPHKDLEQRAFVIKPLLEIAPDFELPGGNKVKDLKIPSGQKVVQLSDKRL